MDNCKHIYGFYEQPGQLVRHPIKNSTEKDVEFIFCPLCGVLFDELKKEPTMTEIK